MEDEIKELRKAISARRRHVGAFRLYTGKRGKKDVLLAVTGVGREKAIRCTRSVLEDFPIEAIISTGFAGGLNENTQSGDVVVYGRLFCAETDACIVAFPGLLNAAECVHSRCNRVLVGNGVSAGGVCATPDGKRSLGHAYGADAVDMESYWIGMLAADRGTPFIALRPVFDAVDNDLTLLTRFTRDGQIAPWRVIGYVLAHPRTLLTMVSYSHQAELARRELARSVTQLIDAA